jgi:hypothetical protein
MIKVKTDEELNIRQNIIFGSAKIISNELWDLLASRTEEEFKKHTVFKNLDESEALNFWVKILHQTNARIFIHIQQVLNDYSCDLDFNKLITDVTNGTRIILGLTVNDHIKPVEIDEPKRIITRGV